MSETVKNPEQHEGLVPFIGDEAQPAHIPERRGKQFVSKGWRIHNEITYRLIDWIVNSCTAVTMGYVTAKTEWGQRNFTQPVTNFFRRVLAPVLKSGNLESGAVWGTRFLSIMAGGFAIIPPVMFMENKNNKKRIVRWLDEKVYGKDAVRNDPKFEESYRSIDAEPHKSFLAGLAARAIALAPIIAAVVTPANGYLKEYVYNPLAKITKDSAEFVGIKPKRMMEKFAVDAKGNRQTNWEFLHETIAFDISLTLLYSFLHEFAYKMLAAFGIRETKPAAAQQAALTGNDTKAAGAVQESASEQQARWTSEVSAKLPVKKSESYVKRVNETSPISAMAQA